MLVLEKIYSLTKLTLHRGLCDGAVENSLKAFLNACKREETWGIETDIQFTADNKCVCFHDKSGKRLMGIKKNIHDFSYDELKRTQIVKDSDTVANICPFKKYVKLCKKYNKFCVIEFKYNFSDKQILWVVKQLKWLRYLHRCVLISFSREVLIKLRKLLPKQKLQLLITNPIKRYLRFCVEQKVDVSLHWRLVGKDTVARLNSLGVDVAVWGVNGYSTALKLAKMGVVMITTDKIM